MSEPAPLYHELANAPPDGAAFWLDAGGVRLRAAVWPGGARGTVLIFTGRTEYIEKYGRVVAALRDRGFSVATLDWRGQGLSDRPLPDRLKGHVGVFSEYLEDVRAFMAHEAVAALPGPRVLLCHSMGGCIGLRVLLEEAVRPEVAILSAPMLGIELSPVLRLGARVLIALARHFGFETASAPAPGGGRPYVTAQPFDGNVLTGDKGHYDWMRKHLEAEPAFGLGAPTLGWMRRSFEEMASLARAPAPATPVLVFLGDREAVVEPDAIRDFAARTPTCRLVDLPGAQHEVFMETAEIQALAWAEIDGFLAAHGL